MTQERKVPGKGMGETAKFGMGFGDRRKITSNVMGMKAQHQYPMTVSYNKAAQKNQLAVVLLEIYWRVLRDQSFTTAIPPRCLNPQKSDRCLYS